MELDELKQLYAGRRRQFSYLDLSYKNLSGWNLSGIILKDSNLEGAILTNINLSSARLPQAQMNRVNLRNANLTGAKLHSASLRHADFTGANLTGTDLRKADLSYACFASAHLDQTLFQDANLEGVDWGEHQPPELIPAPIESATPEAKTTNPPPFREKWPYRPEDLLTPNQKLALSPWLWLGFVVMSYVYQGFYCMQFAKGVYFLLGIMLAGTAPCLWLFNIYWLYPAGLVALIFFSTLDIFIIAFATIVMIFSINGAKKYRSILDKQPPTLSRAVVRDGITLGMGAVLFISLFRSLLIQPATVTFVIAGAISALSGGISQYILRSRRTPPLRRWAMVGGSAWLGLLLGLGLGRLG
jgi:hypothetical protein